MFYFLSSIPKQSPTTPTPHHLKAQRTEFGVRDKPGRVAVVAAARPIQALGRALSASTTTIAAPSLF